MRETITLSSYSFRIAEYLSYFEFNWFENILPQNNQQQYVLIQTFLRLLHHLWQEDSVFKFVSESAHYNISAQVGLPHSYVSINYVKKLLNQELKLKLIIK